MEFALQEGGRVKAQPGQKASCPLCSEVVLAKCGHIKIWHWAHKSLKDCDTWSEGETEWHRQWKQFFPPEMREVIVGNHIADVKTSKGVIEFQRSSLSVDDSAEREKHYGKMIWVLSGKEFSQNFELRKQGYGFSFRWKHPRQTWWFAKKRIFIDGLSSYTRVTDEAGDSIWVENKDSVFLEIKKLHAELPCGGWGVPISKDAFVKMVL